MVAERRFGPLIALVAAGFVVLVARMFHIQVVEHDIWAVQAANLVRSSKVVPYHRGRILDRAGRELVRDEDVYELEFRYRDFRRGHPLAQVAHARSTLEMRAVPLAEALAMLSTWAHALVTLSPADLDRFARGEALPQFGVGATADPGTDLRARRASDLRYYVGELLGIVSREWKLLRPEPESPDRAQPYVVLLAKARKTAPEALATALDRGLATSREHLAFLSGLLRDDLDLGDATAPAGAPPSAPHHMPLGALIDVLQRQRELVEDATADELFELAAGFAPGRIPSELFVRAIDVDWIAKLVRWDRERTLRWMQSRRELYLRDLGQRVLPRILTVAGLEEDESSRAARLLDELALVYTPAAASRHARGERPSAWSELDDPCVLAEFPSLFELPRGAGAVSLPAVALPFQDEEVRAVAEELDDPWRRVGMISELAVARALAREGATEIVETADGADVAQFTARAPRTLAEAAARWQKISQTSPRMDGEAALVELTWLATALESAFAGALEQALERLVAQQDAVDAASAASTALRFSKARRERALQQERFVQKDQSNRPVVLRGEPEYALVRLLARHPERYRGFEVRETTRRVAVARDPHGVPVAAGLIGTVRKPNLRELFTQVREEERLAELQHKPLRSAEDARAIRELSARLYRSDEWTGGSGVEDYFDSELRGRFGYRETASLAERDANGPVAILEPAKDGLDVELTLDLDLQLAAQATLAEPELPSDPKADRLWFENPVGAIVMLSTEGEVLAAASEPTIAGLPKTPGRNLERSLARERTLRRATFNPPGSVFKPFVAAFALDRIDFDRTREFVCAPDESGKGGRYESMHCHGIHYACDLHRALAQSCNAYFAQLGEVMQPAEVIEMASLFGFGQSTGIRHLGLSGRSGLGEDWRIPGADKLGGRLADRADRMRFTNGLGWIEATPMQVARATVGLVTGDLPEVRIARAIGGRPVAHAAVDLGLSASSRRFVLDAMGAAVDEVGGTGYGKGLDRATLGFSFACKTGSADAWLFTETADMTAQDREALAAGKMHKHTWVTGFFPREDPKAVLVVYLHDVSETASHTSVYVAAQFLRTSAVRRFVEQVAGHAVPAPMTPSADGGG